MSTKQQNKIIAIIGPTSAGKTSVAVKLALAIGGEIISADSRQVYRYMDVGTGKDLGEYSIKIKFGASLAKHQTPNIKHQKISNIQYSIPNIKKFGSFKKKDEVYLNIPYHLIDVVHPNTNFDLAKWVRKAKKAILDIRKRGRVPIVCGGSGLYVQALVEGFDLAAVAGEDKELRARLEKKTLPELWAELKYLDFDKFMSLNNSEKNNKRRLIRYIEIAEIGNQPARGWSASGEKSGMGSPSFLRSGRTGGGGGFAPDDFIVFGLTRSREELSQRIRKRLIERLEKEDMIGEVKRLHEKHGVSWKRLESFGLEYKYVSLHLRGSLPYEEMAEKLFIAIRQFAKRQMTWFRRWEKQGRKIYWVNDVKEILEILDD